MWKIGERKFNEYDERYQILIKIWYHLPGILHMQHRYVSVGAKKILSIPTTLSPNIIKNFVYSSPCLSLWFCTCTIIDVAINLEIRYTLWKSIL